MEPGIQKRKDSDPSLRNCRAAAVNSCSQDLERGNSWSWEQFLYIMHGWEKSLFLWLASCPAFLREVRLFTFQLGRRTFHKFFPVILLELMLCERKVFFLLPAAAPLAFTAVFPSFSMASVTAPAAPERPCPPSSASLQRTLRPLYVVPSSARITFCASCSGTSM